jgi:hypothetical protein
MTTCPSCKRQERATADELPAAVRKDMSMFIELSHLLEFRGVDFMRCVNCGRYFDGLTGDIIEKPSDSLSPSVTCVVPALWADFLALPPDLLRIVANECGAGNRVCGSVRGNTARGWVALYMDGYFRDGHMVSSWVAQRPKFIDGRDLSSYICDAMSVALCPNESEAQQAAS